MNDTKNVKLGVCQAFYDQADLGLTKGGVEVSVSTETHVVEVDQFGKTPVDETIMGRVITVKVPMAETTLDNMVRTMPGATLVTDGAQASGSMTIATNPTNGQTVTIGGKTVTFRTAPAGAMDVLLGATAAASAENLAEFIRLSTDGVIGQLTATAATNVVTIKAIKRGTAGNSFTIASGTTGASVTVSGATLTGGVDVTKARVDVNSGIGVSLLSLAKELRLHPKGKSDHDKSEDFVVPLAATAGALTFAYKLEDERIFNVEFKGYVDPVTDRLFYVGDKNAV